MGWFDATHLNHLPWSGFAAVDGRIGDRFVAAIAGGDSTTSGSSIRSAKMPMPMPAGDRLVQLPEAAVLETGPLLGSTRAKTKGQEIKGQDIKMILKGHQSDRLMGGGVLCSRL